MPYQTFAIPKKSGGQRTIAAPDPDLKQEQRLLLREVLEKNLQPSNLAHGFIKGRSIQTNALRHCGKKYVLNMDIHSFFPSCRQNHVPEKISALLGPESLRNCFYRNELPQGAPTSPYLANLYLKDFDCVVVKALRQQVSSDIVYTRYADDMTFSSNSRALEKATEIVPRVLRKWRMVVNDKKTRLASSGMRQEVTGLNVNAGRPMVPKAYRRKVRAIVHRVSRCSWSLTAAQYDKLQGMIGYIALCHPAEAAKYRGMMKQVRRPKAEKAARRINRHWLLLETRKTKVPSSSPMSSKNPLPGASRPRRRLNLRGSFP